MRSTCYGNRHDYDKVDYDKVFFSLGVKPDMTLSWLVEYNKLMGAENRVTVLRPESVRRRLTERCEAALNHHKGVKR